MAEVTNAWALAQDNSMRTPTEGAHPLLETPGPMIKKRTKRALRTHSFGPELQAPGSGLDVFGQTLIDQPAIKLGDHLVAQLAAALDRPLFVRSRKGDNRRLLKRAIQHALRLAPRYLNPKQTPSCKFLNSKGLCQVLAMLIPARHFDDANGDVACQLIVGVTKCFNLHASQNARLSLAPNTVLSTPPVALAWDTSAAMAGKATSGAPSEEADCSKDKTSDESDDTEINKKLPQSSSAATRPAGAAHNAATSSLPHKAKAFMTVAAELSVDSFARGAMVSHKAQNKKRKRSSDTEKAMDHETKLSSDSAKKEKKPRGTNDKSQELGQRAKRPNSIPVTPKSLAVRTVQKPERANAHRTPHRVGDTVSDSSKDDSVSPLRSRAAVVKAVAPIFLHKLSKPLQEVIEIYDDSEPPRNIKVEDPEPDGPDPRTVTKKEGDPVYVVGVQKEMLKSKNEKIRFLTGVLDTLGFEEDDVEMIHFRMGTNRESLKNAVRAVKEDKRGKKTKKSEPKA